MDNLRSKMDRAVYTRKEESEQAKKRYDKSSQERLFAIMKKKLETSFIGALSQFESFFGQLWGKDKDRRDLTPKEKEFKELWEQARTNILNNGNNQVRAIQNELNQYTITWNRYQLTLKAVSKEDIDDSRTTNHPAV